MRKKLISTLSKTCTGVGMRREPREGSGFEPLDLKPVDMVVRSFKDGSSEVNCPYAGYPENGGRQFCAESQNRIKEDINLSNKFYHQTPCIYCNSKILNNF